MSESYLSAVRHMQITHGMEDPRIGEMPQLELIVKGLKMEQTSLPTKA